MELKEPMKLVVQIPCHNEGEHLPATLAAIPSQIEGVTAIEVLVIDDGSTDGTAEVAREHGVGHILRFARRRGLAQAFRAGIDTGLRLGADIIVNTDGDNQYEGADIAKLVAPVLAGDADIAIGDRDPGALKHFSWAKRKLQRLGSWFMRRLSGTHVADATSGFRAYSREAATRLNVVTDFTYTLETLIQAGKLRLAVVDVPVRTHPTERASRLAPTMLHYLAQAGTAMARAYALYEPLKIFSVLGIILSLSGVALGGRFLYFFWFVDGGRGHVQSLILAAILAIVGFQVLCLAVLADLLAGNRKLVEEALYRLRRIEHAAQSPISTTPCPEHGGRDTAGTSRASSVDSSDVSAE
jgi:glycosyltransferase involved in cell wall biosynthesis